MTHCSETTIYD